MRRTICETPDLMTLDGQMEPVEPRAMKGAQGDRLPTSISLATIKPSLQWKMLTVREARIGLRLKDRRCGRNHMPFEKQRTEHMQLCFCPYYALGRLSIFKTNFYPLLYM